MEYFFILTLLIITIYIGYIILNGNNKKNDPIFQENVGKINRFLDEVNEAKKGYFTNSIKEHLLEAYKDQYRFCRIGSLRGVKDENISLFKETYYNINELVEKWNEDYVENELLENLDLFNNIDGKTLDEQQRRAVVVDEDNNLVLAGAGSGKTLTISGKVKYLVDVKNIKSDEILLISFTKKAADEMNKRISQKLDLSVEAKTFHKLGLDIIKHKRKKTPDISDSLNKVIDKYFKETIYKNNSNFKKLTTFYGCYVNIPKDIDEFENLGEYYKYYKSIDLTTIKGKYEMQKLNEIQENELKSEKKTLSGEQVKSIEEVMIANYLYLNGVKYIYEYKYPYDTQDNYRKNYRPDFYLPDYDIYIEHFGISKNYKTPWLSKIEEQKYLDAIKWKRELHEKYGTTLVETYSYYNTEGILLTKLESKLIKLGVKFSAVDCEDIYNTIIDNKEDKYFKEFRKLISTFIGLFKSRGFILKNFEGLSSEAITIKNGFLRERNLLFLNIVKPIYIYYQELLEKNNEIDFNDMIIDATKIVKNNEANFSYKYIIIDEYQDISKSRFDLIKEIKKQTNAKLMCVGDDWQSIYRFTGSEIDFFTNFENYVGYYELLKIEKTYRNSQQLINTASKFVMKNKNQLRKDLKSEIKLTDPISIIYYKDDIFDAINRSIDNIVKEFGNKSEAVILGRNNFDVKVFENNINYKVIKKDNDVIIKSKIYPKLALNYLTAHKSKGLEAENVIIINLENSITGFPNQMTDDPVLDLVLTQSDNFIYSEERRLFYVALTRTRNKSYLIAPQNKSSIFCDELVKDLNINIELLDNDDFEKKVLCPKCREGNLIIRADINKSEFLGCSNYPLCNFTTKSIEILDKTIICNSCGGYMVERSGYNGKFLGCSNYPKCKNTQDYIKTYPEKNHKLISEIEDNYCSINNQYLHALAYDYNSNADVEQKDSNINDELEKSDLYDEYINDWKYDIDDLSDLDESYRYDKLDISDYFYHED